jgi:3-methyladenine DNA glycosylase/8-oxoguanine DNA glycosylase
MPRQAVFTIGHSTRSLDELADCLKSFGIATLADVRTIPRSRHNPQFNRDRLRRRFHYVHLPHLGGLRHPRKDSPNAEWRNSGFRGFADYMQTPDFETGLRDLLRLEKPIAVMCAEAVPWRCHRSLIADALSVRGLDVEHISAPGRASRHHLTPFARVQGETITYPRTTMDVSAPFNLEATVRVLQRRPTNLVDVWDDGRYVRVLGRSVLEVTNRGTIEAPELHLNLPEHEPTIRRILGLDVPPIEVEPKLRGMRPPRFPTLFETFTNVIPFQQVSLDSGVATVRRLVQRFSKQVKGRWAFPAAETIAEARVSSLKACGLSTAKSQTLRNVARLIEDDVLSESQLTPLSSAAAIERLTELPGIGPWSASLVLLRGLGRLDVFPIGDVGARKIERWARRFGEQQGYAYFVGLGRSLLKRGLISA